MAFITKSNAKKTIRQLNEAALVNIAEPIYKRSIYFFSTRENANLKGIREMFRDLDLFMIEYYHPIQVRDTYKYLYPETQPAYHRDNTCDRLLSKFMNIEVPIAIQEKGASEVLRFRKWYLEQSFGDNPKEFIEKVQLAFPGVEPINPRAIDYENSGAELKEDYSLDELEEEIEAILDKAEMYFEENPLIRDIIYKYQKLTFLAHIKGPLTNNHSGLDDNDLKAFLLSYEQAFKIPVKERLIEYYRILFNPDMTFNGDLLDKLGFRSCSACLPK